MAFKHQAIGAAVSNNATAAHEQLVELFRTHTTRAAVAKACTVDERTLARWIKRLGDEGFEDPRDVAAVPRRGRPAA